MKQLLTALTSLALSIAAIAQTQFPKSQDVMNVTEKVADHFIADYPDVGANSYVGGKKRNSKIWTRGVFYEGLLNAYRQNPRADWLKYCTDWGEYHKWISSSDTEAKRHNADYQCCGQAYLQMYMMEPAKAERMSHIKMRIDDMIGSGAINYWYWVDAVQMSMPVMAMLGEITGNGIYSQKMFDMYMYTRDSQGGSKRGGGSPLFNTSTGLWYRDYQFDPPYKDLTERDKDCYWSRGNGWAYMALVRILQFGSPDDPHRQQYISDYLAMSEALKKCQNPAGWWNVSLAAPSNFGAKGSEGPEMTSSALFAGGMAYGVAAGLLNAEDYLDAISRGWEAMAMSVHPNGKVGYLQGTGSKPEDGGPITFDSTPDFEDFGVGCWLWGAAEIHALALKLEEAQSALPVITLSPDDDDKAYYDLLGRRVADPSPGQLYIHHHKLIRK